MRKHSVRWALKQQKLTAALVAEQQSKDALALSVERLFDTNGWKAYYTRGARGPFRANAKCWAKRLKTSSPPQLTAMRFEVRFYLFENRGLYSPTDITNCFFDANDEVWRGWYFRTYSWALAGEFYVEES